MEAERRQVFLHRLLISHVNTFLAIKERRLQLRGKFLSSEDTHQTSVRFRFPDGHLLQHDFPSRFKTKVIIDDFKVQLLIILVGFFMQELYEYIFSVGNADYQFTLYSQFPRERISIRSEDSVAKFRNGTLLVEECDDGDSLALEVYSEHAPATYSFAVIMAGV